MKAGRVVVMLNGRYAGCKAVVLKVIELPDGPKVKGFKSKLIVCGLAEAPKPVTKKVLKANEKLEGAAKEAADKKVLARQSLKTFVKVVNVTHVMPTRYTNELHEDLSGANEELLKEKANRQELRKKFKEKLVAKYKNLGTMADGKVQRNTHYFFKCVAQWPAAAAPLAHLFFSCGSAFALEGSRPLPQFPPPVHPFVCCAAGSFDSKNRT
jgi:large subunit ribosomal protein L27e